MSSPSIDPPRLEGFNVVMVCQNFPVQAVELNELEFRGRKFKEHLRIGPALQASTRNVELFVVPDRVQVSVNSPDDLDIMCAGVVSVFETLIEYVGRRTVSAIGHNAQAFITGLGVEDPLEQQLVDYDLSEQLLESPVFETQLSLVSKVGRETMVRVSRARDIASKRAVLDFNFDFQVLEDGQPPLMEALGELRTSLGHAERIAKNFATRSAGVEVGS